MEVIREASKHKKHIYCEKPISLQVEEVEEAFKVAKENNVVLVCAWNRRFDPHFSALQKILQEQRKELGKPMLVSSHNGDHPLPPTSILCQLGSIFHDLMVHDIDLDLFYSQQFPTSVFATGTAFSQELREAGVFDTGVYVMTFSDGSVAICTGRRSSSMGYDQRVEVLTEKGSLLKVNNIPQSSVVLNGCGSDEWPSGYRYSKINHTFVDRYKEAYSLEVNNLTELLLDASEPKSNYQECKSVSLLSDAALQSSKSNKVVLFK